MFVEHCGNVLKDVKNVSAQMSDKNIAHFCTAIVEPTRRLRGFLLQILILIPRSSLRSSRLCGKGISSKYPTRPTRLRQIAYSLFWLRLWRVASPRLNCSPGNPPRPISTIQRFNGSTVQHAL